MEYSRICTYVHLRTDGAVIAPTNICSKDIINEINLYLKSEFAYHQYKQTLQSSL